MLLAEDNIKLTLFLRMASRLEQHVASKVRIIEADALDLAAMREAVKGQDIVYINLVGDLQAMNKNIVTAMKDEGVSSVIFISSIGIYETPLRAVLIPYRKGADVIETSGLDYTILRPEWFSDAGSTVYETSNKGTPERGGTISRKGLATLIADIIKSPDKFSKANLGVNSPR
jgi:uncharacterized protein YbjT (DUF2867 family)